MTSLRRLNKSIDKHSLEMVQQRLAVREFCKGESKKLTLKQILFAMGGSFVAGGLAQTLLDERSATGRIAKQGAGFAFANLFHSVSTLTGFSAIFVYAQLKHFLLGKK